MRLGIGLSICGIGSVSPFDPVSLFAGGDLGFIFDLSDQTAVFQETSSPSTPSGNGDPIGTLVDLSGNAMSVAAPDNTHRPSYVVSGAQAWAAFVSASAHSLVKSNGSFIAPITVVAAVRITEDVGANQEILCGASSFPRIEMRRDSDSTIIFDSISSSFTLDINEDVVITGKFGDAGTSSVAKNNASYESAAAGLGGALGISFGVFNGSTNPASMRLYRAIGIKRILSDAEIANCRTWCGAAAGLIL